MATIPEVESGIEQFLDKTIQESAPPVDDDDDVQEVQEEEAPKKSESEKEPATSEESSEIETFEQLAEAFGKTPEELAEILKTKIKVDHEEKDVSLAELKAGYQKGEAYEQRKAKLQEERQQFELQHKEKQEALGKHWQQTQQLGQFLESQLVGAMNSDQLKELRIKNPGEFAAVMQEINAKRAQLQQALHYQANQVSAQQAAVEAETKQRREAQLSNEISALKEKLPDFDRDGAVKYMQSMGFSESQLDIDSHLWLVMVDKAMKYDNSKKEVDPIKNKLKLLPKLMKAGKSVSAPASKVLELSSRLKKSGSSQDMAKIIEYQLSRGKI
jgi:hypothetical protein